MVVSYSLPERQENNQFNRKDFQKRAMFLDILADLVVELDQAVHGDSNADRFEDNDLVNLR